ncbi:hypothetical protein SCUP234_12408 [Seiridium cupressi]
MSGAIEDVLSPLLCVIPVEVRLIIFEFAVKIDKVVVPRQITEHSNKFTWGERKQVPVHDHPGNRDYVWECQENERLAVASLNLTCKQFYEELRDYPVFYRVNQFHFEMEDLVPYLAAITPQRRNVIQNIALTGACGSTSWENEVPKSRRSIALRKHAFALLSQCQGLRNVHVILESLHGIPCTVKTARTSRKEFSPSAVQQAVEFAGLDIGGTDRACGYCPVHPSTHTRFEMLKQKRQDNTMDYKLGTLKRELLPRYDPEGRLLWRVREILSIRRGSRGPKCQVKWWNTGSKATVEWEDAGSLMSQEGLELFRKFYDDSAEKYTNFARSTTSKRDLEAELARFFAIPAPADIQALQIDLFKKRALQSRWRRLQRDYERAVYLLRAYHVIATERERKDNLTKRAALDSPPDTQSRKRTKVRGSK